MNISERQLCEDIFMFVERFKHEIGALSDANGLTRMQTFVLYSIYRHGDSLVMGQVAEALHCDASNVTGIVDRLVMSGLVVRHENPEDRRTKSLRLTTEGEHVIDGMLSVLPARLGCRLTQEERAVLHQLLHKTCRQ